MADKTKTSYVLIVNAKFADGDTRTLSIENPNTSINIGNAIYTLGAYCQQHNLLVGDLTGAAFSEFSFAKVRTKTETDLDLGF